MGIEFERRCWAEIDLDKLRQNYALVQSAAPRAGVMAVVKANAYGHGDLVCSRVFQEAGASRFAVSGLEEAVHLRHGGIRRPILVLGYTSPQYAARLRRHNIAQCVYSLAYARRLSAAAVAAGVRLRIHIKVDTGMARLGFNAAGEPGGAVRQIAEACRLPGFLPVGIFTHLSAADSAAPTDIAYTREQYRLFCETLSRLKAEGIIFRYAHCCNSAGVIAYPAMHLDAVRPGIVLYGCNPSGEVGLAGLQPVFQLKTTVTMVKTIPAGSSVSYGRTFRAPQDMRIATLAVGYADGYPRLLSGVGVVGIGDRPAPVLGRVCMDQMTVDVSSVPRVQLGDTATVFGGGGGDSVEEVAAKSGTIPYEILCNIGRRVQRVYVKDGRETLLADYMAEHLGR